MNIVSTFTILGDVVVRWSYLINNMLFLESGELQDCVECVTTGLTGMLNSFYQQPIDIIIITFLIPTYL